METVNVLMSVYNGEEYLEEQIRSILIQQNVNIFITVRDDGSTDATRNILRKFNKQYPSRFLLIFGKNLGYRKSFLRLIRNAAEADYYAFSDQDDVWQPDKCERAVRMLKKTNNCHLYVSAIVNTNEKLAPVSVQKFDGNKTMKSVFVRNRYPGCAMVFDHAVLRKASQLRFPRKGIIPSHDMIISALAYMMGEVYTDNRAAVYHRRCRGSITAGGRGITSRIQAEYRLVFQIKHEACILADSMLRTCMDDLDRKSADFLKTVTKSRTGIRAGISLLKDTEFSCGIRICDLETKIKIIIGNY